PIKRIKSNIKKGNEKLEDVSRTKIMFPDQQSTVKCLSLTNGLSALTQKTEKWNLMKLHSKVKQYEKVLMCK
ncbi:MAG: hypothetical protein AB2705_22750, partial [Candidatus Thiodiazotropha sp.]